MTGLQNDAHAPNSCLTFKAKKAGFLISTDIAIHVLSLYWHASRVRVAIRLTESSNLTLEKYNVIFECASMPSLSAPHTVHSFLSRFSDHLSDLGRFPSPA